MSAINGGAAPINRHKLSGSQATNNYSRQLNIIQFISFKLNFNMCNGCLMVDNYTYCLEQYLLLEKYGIEGAEKDLNL